MRRRHFVAALAAVVATPTLGLATVFAEAEKVRHIGVLMGLSESNPDLRVFVATFVEELARLGWIEGRNAAIRGIGQTQICSAPVLWQMNWSHHHPT